MKALPWLQVDKRLEKYKLDAAKVSKKRFELCRVAADTFAKPCRTALERACFSV